MISQQAEKKPKGVNLIFALVAVILASALWKQYAGHGLTFKQPALAALYAVTLVGALYLLLRDYTKPA